MRFLVLFRAHHRHFALAELRAIASLVRNNTTEELKLFPAIDALGRSEGGSEKKAAGLVLHGEVYYYVELGSEEEAIEVTKRCLLIKAVLIPGGQGRNYNQCLNEALRMLGRKPYCDMVEEELKVSFKCKVVAFGRKYSMKEQKDRMGRFTDLLSKFTGKVQLRNPAAEFWIMEDVFPTEGHVHETTHDEEPRQVFMGRKIAEGAAFLGHKFTLKRRMYIGPTSMDAELAFIMLNMARVRKGSLVLDPFCGTGSILVSASALQAHTIGSDMNIRILRGNGGNNVISNFDQYNLRKPLGLLRCDLLHSAVRLQPWLDAIVCDPPYGIKEGTRAFKKATPIQDHSLPYFPPTMRVRFCDLLHHLLAFAADTLVPGGRLVYWLPTTTEYTDTDAPSDPALRIVSNCEQPLNARMSRRLITMERVGRSEESRNRARAEGQPVSSKVPAHFNLAAKIMRQPHRSENRLSAFLSTTRYD